MDRRKAAGNGTEPAPWELYKGGEREEKKQECRKRLEKILPQVIQECEQKTGVHAEEWRLRDMKTRWGTCNVQKKRICLMSGWVNTPGNVWNMWLPMNWSIFWREDTTKFFMDIWMRSIPSGKM